MDLLEWCSNGSLAIWAVQDFPEVYLVSLCMGRLELFLREADLCQVPYNSSNFLKTLSV
jgi:hypothetical protein